MRFTPVVACGCGSLILTAVSYTIDISLPTMMSMDNGIVDTIGLSVVLPNFKILWKDLYEVSLKKCNSTLLSRRGPQILHF